MKFSDFDEYQKKCKTTAAYPGIGNNFIYPSMGLVGEAGEVANKIKKIIRDDESKLTKENVDALAHELGDIMWYIAQLSTELKLKLSDVAKMNLEKLASRKIRGKIHGSGDNR